MPPFSPNSLCRARPSSSRACAGIIPLAAGYIPQVEERVGAASLLPQLPLDSQALPKKGACAGIIPLAPGHKPQVVERVGDASLVPQLPLDSQALLKQRACAGIIPLSVG